MNRKKVKEEYDVIGVLNKLTRLMVDEQLVNKQKTLIYLKYKTYHELFLKEKEKNKELEKENISLYAKEVQPVKQKEEDDKENLQNIDLNVDLNQLEFSYEEKDLKEVDDSQNLVDKLSELSEKVSERDKKIIELENKVIKLQVARRYESITNLRSKQCDTTENWEKEEIIELKSKLEYSRVEGERDRRELNAKLREFITKYEETKAKYNLCYAQLGNSLNNLEDIRKFHMSREIQKTKNVTLLKSQIRRFEFVMKDLENQIYALHRVYADLSSHLNFLENKNKELHERINKYSIISAKINVKDEDDFYEKEISSLLEVCDSLIEENKRLTETEDILKSRVDSLNRRNLSLEKEHELIKLKEAASFENVQKYLQNIDELTEAFQESSKKLEMSNSERNKLTKLNVERISLLEKYKEDLRNKDIEINLLKNKYNETLVSLEEYNKRFEKRLRMKPFPSDGIFIPCNLCDLNCKNIALISCMHTFCDKCIETRIKLRNRRCPTCATPFGSNDVKKFYI